MIDWWIGNALSLLIVTWARNPKSLEVVHPFRIFEGGALILLLGSVAWLVFDKHIFIENEIIPSYFVFPILVWSALRFSQCGATSGLFILSGLAIWFTSTGSGEAFISLASAHDNVLVVKSVIVATSITTLLLATLVTELRIKQAAIEEGKERFNELTNSINCNHQIMGEHKLWRLEQFLR